MNIFEKFPKSPPLGKKFQNFIFPFSFNLIEFGLKIDKISNNNNNDENIASCPKNCNILPLLMTWLIIVSSKPKLEQLKKMEKNSPLEILKVFSRHLISEDFFLGGSKNDPIIFIK